MQHKNIIFALTVSIIEKIKTLSNVLSTEQSVGELVMEKF